VPPVRDGVPDAEVETQEQAEEDPAVAGVERAPVVVGAERAGGGGGEEARDIVAVLVSEIAEETEHGGRAVELRESSAEAAVGDDAAPGLADEGGAEEARGIRRRGRRRTSSTSSSSSTMLLGACFAGARCGGAGERAERGFWSAGKAKEERASERRKGQCGIVGWLGALLPQRASR